MPNHNPRAWMNHLWGLARCFTSAKMVSFRCQTASLGAGQCPVMASAKRPCRAGAEGSGVDRNLTFSVGTQSRTFFMGLFWQSLSGASYFMNTYRNALSFRWGWPDG